MFKEDFRHIPTECEMKEYINNDLWEDFSQYMKNNKRYEDVKKMIEIRNR